MSAGNAVSKKERASKMARLRVDEEVYTETIPALSKGFCTDARAVAAPCVGTAGQARSKGGIRR